MPHYRVPDAVIARSIGEDLLIHRFETDEVFVLNPHARMLFEALKESGDLDEAKRRVSSKFVADTAVLKSAIDKALGEMLQRNLLVVVE
jgi:hypothetical protein